MADSKDSPNKYLRENISDLQEYAKRLLEQTGRPTPNKDKLMEGDVADWNIRNWGNFWNDNPAFYNH